MSEVKEFKEFPKWIYHKDTKINPRIVKTKEEQDMWGEDWKESPADHIKEEKEFVLEEATIEELGKLAIEQGLTKRKVKDLTKDQLIVLLKGDV